MESCDSPLSCESSCPSNDEALLRISNIRNATIANNLQAELNKSACEETYYPVRNKYEYKYCCNLYEEEDDDGDFDC